MCEREKQEEERKEGSESERMREKQEEERKEGSESDRMRKKQEEERKGVRVRE